MKTFSKYRDEGAGTVDDAMASIIDIMEMHFGDSRLSTCICEQDEKSIIDEGLKDKFHAIVKKSGLHVKKSKGLIGHLMSAGKGVAKLFVALINKDAEGAKKVLKSIKKEDVLDFLFNLDQATLHIITGPIHTLDAVTGWHIWANVKKKSQTAKKIAIDAIKSIKDVITNIYDKAKAKMYSRFVDKMEKDIVTI